MSTPISLMIDNRVADGSSAATRPDAGKILEAAREFEALMIGELLKHMRESGSGGWLGGGEDQAAATAVGYAEEALAKAMSASGGLGLASMIARGLEAPRTAAPAAPAKN